MPLQIQRTATVYLLWDDSDIKALFEGLSAAGWLCTLTIVDGVWQVALQHSANRVLVTAPRSSVVISDGLTVAAQSVDEFNTANPGHRIEEGS